ncbi:AI-2E family transporter [Thermus islandicus]|uniref:AI-2E family transporter n=1 Tax=Thermus islandicus TaxID=540988 RepID=UPI0004134D3C|nr:AI-2E family transporter [Thermus islandicus]
MESVNRFFLQAGLFLLGLWALVKLYPLLLWVFFAFTLAAALDPLVGFFERGPGGLGRRFPRPTAVFLAYALVLSVFALGFYAAFPLLSAQFKNLSQLLPAYLERLLATTGLTLPELTGALASSARVAGGLLVKAAGVVSEFVLALVLAVMISLEPHLVARFAPYLPGRGWAEALEETWRRMGYWARAQFLIALSFALLFGGWLALIGVPAPFALGALGGVLEVIPFVGGITIALIATLVALSSQGPLLALLVVLGYAGVALLEGKVLIPLIYGKTVGFHPALVLLAIFAFGKLFGLLGIFLAVPFTILLAGLWRKWRLDQPAPEGAAREKAR